MIPLDELWNEAHLVELHSRGTRDIFDRARAACRADDPAERILGVRVLRELGGSPPRYAAEAVPFLLAMLEVEAVPDVVTWIISAIGYQHMSGERPRLVPRVGLLAQILAFAAHPDARVRHAVAAALPCLVDLAAPEPEAIRTLVALAADADANTRYYALSALTDDLDATDQPAVRAELERRATADDDAQIRRAAQRVLDGGDWHE